MPSIKCIWCDLVITDKSRARLRERAMEHEEECEKSDLAARLRQLTPLPEGVLMSYLNPRRRVEGKAVDDLRELAEMARATAAEQDEVLCSINYKHPHLCAACGTGTDVLPQRLADLGATRVALVCTACLGPGAGAKIRDRSERELLETAFVWKDGSRIKALTSLMQVETLR